LSLKSPGLAAEQLALRPSSTNVAARLVATAKRMPEAVAIVEPAGRGKRRKYRTISFRELDRDSDVLAGGLRELGIAPGMRVALLVRPGIDFIALVFALFKIGAVAILIDPGMGRRRLVSCLSAVRPEGFIAIPVAQAVRRLLRSRFPLAQYNVTVGRRLFWGGPTLEQLRRKSWAGPEMADTDADTPAAIIFTTGSTGPAKGVLYCHGNFNRQVDELREQYAILPGEIDLAAFPLFALFNCALGVTTVIPDMDASRPARVNPRRIVEVVDDWHVTQAFGSPAIWDRVGRYCSAQRVRLGSLRRVLSAGAPVPPEVLARMKACMPDDGQVHTPYGATEALPVASIEAGEVLAETQFRWRTGSGTCVGRRFPGIQWMVIRPVDGPIAQRTHIEPCRSGEIGELIVRGPVVTREYVTRTDANRLAKIHDGETFWHRMGDLGYLDDQERFWFCGRMAHRVLTARGPMNTIPCEAIFNQHPAIARSALVGIGPPGSQTPVIVCQPKPGEMPRRSSRRQQLVAELRALAEQHEHTQAIRLFLFHRAFPVDIRHNAKIFREKLAVWASRRLPTAF